MYLRMFLLIYIYAAMLGTSGVVDINSFDARPAKTGNYETHDFGFRFWTTSSADDWNLVPESQSLKWIMSGQQGSDKFIRPDWELIKFSLREDFTPLWNRCTKVQKYLCRFTLGSKPQSRWGCVGSLEQIGSLIILHVRLQI